MNAPSRWLRLPLFGLAVLLMGAASLGPRPQPQPAPAVAAAGCEDDPYEPDDAVGHARKLAVGERQTRALCDEDWVRFEVNPSEVYVLETRNLTGGANTALDLNERTGCARVGTFGFTPICAEYRLETTFSDDDSGGGGASRLVYRGGLGAWARVREASGAYGGGKGYDIALRCVSDCAEEGRSLIVPAAAHATGADGTLFQTDLSVFHPGPAYPPERTPHTVRLVFTPAGPDGPASRVERTLTLEPGETARLEDVLPALFGVARGAGSLEVRSAGSSSGGVVVRSRTYPDGGAGESIPAQPPAEWGGQAGNRYAPFIPYCSTCPPDLGLQELHLLGLKGGAFRTNVGFLETTGGPVTVVADLYDRTGRLLGQRTFELPPFGQRQINDVFGVFGVAPEEDARMSLRTAAPSGLILGYATVIDNASTDFLYLPGELARDARNRFYPLVLPVLGAASGEERTDLRVLNAESKPGDVVVRFLPGEGELPEALTRTLAPGEMLALDDAVASLGSRGPGLLLVEGQGRLAATARTYRPGSRVTGTSGHTVRALRPGPQDPLGYYRNRSTILLGPGDASSKVTLGLARLRPSPSTSVAVTAYSSDDRALATRGFTLEPSTTVHEIRDLFAELGASREESVRLELELTDKGTFQSRHVLGVAVEGDPESGDAVLVPAERTEGYQQIQVTLPGGLPLTLARQSGGSAMIGSPETEQGRDPDEREHRVTIRPYFLGETEVSQAQWNAVMGLPGGSARPVAGVSWNDVAGRGGFLERLNVHLAATSQDGAGLFRLPTEAEWEVAARDGTATRFPSGDRVNLDDACGFERYESLRLWFCGNSAVLGGPKPVGLYTHSDATGLVVATYRSDNGLYDMLGNVWEWVADWYAPFDEAPRTEPQGPATGSSKVIRGCGWNSEARLCRSANRFGYPPDGRYDHVGFRVARSR